MWTVGGGDHPVLGVVGARAFAAVGVVNQIARGIVSHRIAKIAGLTPVLVPKTERTSFGQRLHTLREQAGLSQQQLADRIGLSQRAYAYWERHPVALRPDQLLKLAEALHVSVEDLVGTNGAKKRGSGPTGKMRQLFEAASRLPRSQQQKIAAIIEPFIAHHAPR